MIDTILNGLPVPELYMQDIVDLGGNETHIVVDGQQRIRACLEFVTGMYKLEGDEVASRWRGLAFEDLSPDDKQLIYGYKFVVRVLPPMNEEELRKIFARLNRNVVALNDQELRNATYWGPFISTIQRIADSDPFWAESGVFSANDHRRMLDHEFISELAIAFLHGPQNKKDNIEHFYKLYEQSFEAENSLENTFRATTGEISQILPTLQKTRWRKKSDFYTLFICIAQRQSGLPFTSELRNSLSRRLLSFGSMIDSLVRIEESDWGEIDKRFRLYARNVIRAASDKSSRIERESSLSSFLFE